MASSTERLVIVTIVTCFLMGLGSTLKLETTPEPFNVFAHKQINITCIGDGPSFWARDVVLMEIGRQEEKPIAIVNAKTKRTDMGPGSGPNMQAVGHIDKESTHSFLTVIINKPGIDDAGTYICRMFYVDEEFQIEEETALVNMTVDNQDMVAMVTYLIERVSALENSTKECEDTIDSQSRQIRSQNHQIDVINDVITNLSDTIKGYDHQIKSQGQHVTVLETAITEVTHNMTTKDTTQCAFSMGYNKANTLVNDQILKFTDPITNIGHHYNPDTGIFTAPRDGVYVFHLVLMSWTAKDFIYIHLHHNYGGNSVVASVYARGDDAHVDQSSLSIVLSLVQGDTVYSRVGNAEGTDNLSPSLYSIFSGFLLKAL